MQNAKCKLACKLSGKTYNKLFSKVVFIISKNMLKNNQIF